MIKRFNGTLSDRVERVHIWTDAHESESSGVDKEMDLINNEIGRYYGYLNYTKSNQYIIDGLRENVRNRGLVRIVNGELVATNAWNGWVWE